MKNKTMKTVLPVILGVSAVLAILVAINIALYNGNVFTQPDNGFFKSFVPIATIIAIAIQFMLTLPIWNKFKKYKKLFGLSLIPFTGIICIVSGLAFGFVFWERDFGVDDLIYAVLTGIVAFSVYWAINLLTLKKIDKLK